jgi:alkylated DNA nucleotide flippase Atl1
VAADKCRYAERVLDVVDRIPTGRVLAYGDIADYLGEGSARVVGHVMAISGHEVAWHRVLRTDGSCAPRVRARQVVLLRAEGVPFRADRADRVDMAAARWDGNSVK